MKKALYFLLLPLLFAGCGPSASPSGNGYQPLSNSGSSGGQTGASNGGSGNSGGGNDTSGSNNSGGTGSSGGSGGAPPDVYFGGLYQTSNLGCDQANPVTGAKSCPNGYSDNVVSTITGLDTCGYLTEDQVSLHLCTLPQTPVAKNNVFGGAYQTSNLGCDLPNPATGKDSCPLNYNDVLVFLGTGPSVCGGSPDQMGLHLCYSTTFAPSNFGGFYQTSNGGCGYNNPLTNPLSPSCPAGFTDSVPFITMGPNACTGTNDQLALHACWKL